MLLTGRIIWPNSLSLVNLTNFPLEQLSVPNVLGPKKKLSKRVNSLRHVGAGIDGGRSWSELCFCVPWTFLGHFPHDSIQIVTSLQRSCISSCHSSKFQIISPNTARSRLFTTPVLENLGFVKISRNKLQFWL